MNFNYCGKNLPPINEIHEAEKAFIKQLGEFREEFEQQCGSVLINFDEPRSSKKFYNYNLRKGSISNFSGRLNEAMKVR
jgi:hypothetical protein